MGLKVDIWTEAYRKGKWENYMLPTEPRRRVQKKKALWMHYSAMLGHSNQRFLSACIYCVNNDWTLKFSTEAVCLSFPLHPVPSSICSVYPVSTEDSDWLEMFRWAISPPLNPISFHARSLCSWSKPFLFDFSGSDLCLVIPLVSLS